VDIVVNGEPLQTQTGVTIEDWLKEKGLLGKHIVVELNERIVKREEWAGVVLQQGDRMEIVTFVGGG
jgi:thiamine biosynthesis protein ThiS